MQQQQDGCGGCSMSVIAEMLQLSSCSIGVQHPHNRGAALGCSELQPVCSSTQTRLRCCCSAVAAAAAARWHNIPIAPRLVTGGAWLQRAAARVQQHQDDCNGCSTKATAQMLLLSGCCCGATRVQQERCCTKAVAAGGTGTAQSPPRGGTSPPCGGTSPVSCSRCAAAARWLRRLQHECDR